MANDITAPAEHYKKMKPKWDLLDALWGGTRAMRKAGVALLPKYKKEAPEDYQARLQRSFLFNGYKKTVVDHCNRPFRRQLVVGKESNPLIEDWKGNIDRNGSTLSTFSKTILQDMLNYSFGLIFVDFPKLTEKLNLKEMKDQGVRPYFSRINPNTLIGAEVEVIDGVEVLKAIRIMEWVLMPDPENPFTDKLELQVRRVTRQEFQIWRKSPNDEWEQVKALTSVNTLGEIPLIPIYANKVAAFEGDPPLEDLGEMNVRHWQSQSDQDHILHIARVPLLFGKGMKADDIGDKIAPNGALVVDSPEADLKYVEHTGKSIAAGKEDIESIENRMRVLGAQIMVKRPGNETATAKSIDSAQEMSSLQSIVGNLEGGLEKAFKMAGKWLEDSDFQAQIEINKDFGISIADASHLDVLFKARMANDIDQKTFLTEIKRRGLLDDEADIGSIIDLTKLNEPEPED